MKKLNFISLLFALTVSLYSCYPPEPDPVNPKLLKYTETGQNTASAIVNDTSVWISESPYISWDGRTNYMTLTSDTTKHKLSLTMFGVINEKEQVHIYFNVSGFKFIHVSDAVLLKGKKISFDGKENYVELYFPHDGITRRINEGQIYFKNVFIDSSAAIISGGFGFKSSADHISYTYGRFDYSVLNGHFFIK